MKFTIRVDDLSFVFLGRGGSSLQLTDPAEMVFRKSDFISPRTVALHCDAAAIDLPRELVRLLHNPKTIGSLQIDALPEWTSSESEIPRIEFS